MVPDFASIDSPWLFWLMAIAVGMLVGFAKCGVAGAGVLAVPLMAMLFPADKSPGILLPILVVGDVMALIYYKKHAVWKHVLRALPWALAGIISCWAVMQFVDIPQQLFKRLIGAIVLIVLGLGQWFQQRKKDDALEIPHSWWFAAIIGLVGGGMTMAANAAGPIFAIYLLSLQLPKESYLGTSAWIFFILNLSKVPFWVTLDGITVSSLQFDMMMVPVVLIGGLLGVFVLKKIPEKGFVWAVKILTVLSALKLLLW